MALAPVLRVRSVGPHSRGDAALISIVFCSRRDRGNWRFQVPHKPSLHKPAASQRTTKNQGTTCLPHKPRHAVQLPSQETGQLRWHRGPPPLQPAESAVSSVQQRNAMAGSMFENGREHGGTRRRFTPGDWDRSTDDVYEGVQALKPKVHELITAVAILREHRCVHPTLLCTQGLRVPSAVRSSTQRRVQV